MVSPWQVYVYEGSKRVAALEGGGGAVELGRQSAREEPLYATSWASGRQRLVIARLDEDTISRQHVLLEPVGTERVRLTNLSRKMPIRLGDGGELKPGQSCESDLPVVLSLGNRTVRLQPPEEEEGEQLEALAEATMPPGTAAPRSAVQFPTLAAANVAGHDMEAVIRWLQTTVGVLQSAATSGDFFTKAAQAVVELVGLDAGRVLLLDAGKWKVEALHAARGATGGLAWQPSRQVMARVQQEKRTFWQVPSHTASLAGVNAVVASPILNRQGEVIGALYGDRRRGSAIMPISKAEAMLVELLAGVIAAGLARMEQERAALAARIQFEQFFTPGLSRHLEAQPDLLEGRECPVTILVCDIRGFSRISEQQGPANTIKWLREVLSVLSDCVLDRDGVVVDYTGDEVLAMWGAPAEQPDHARTACEAAVAMMEALPKLNEKWEPVLGQRMGVGIGIHTGPAMVGNTGSHRKFKYGPHGTTVNLASRVQGASKYLRTTCLITGATHAQLDGAFPTRRLCKVEVVNIKEPVELYDLALPGRPNWGGLRLAYEHALEEFEGGGHRKAAALLDRMTAEFPDDGPSAVLLERARKVGENKEQGSAVWRLPGK
jgi:adenylate cyclase